MLTSVIFVMEICILVLPTGEQQSSQPALQQPTRQPAVYTVGCIESYYQTGEAEHAGSRASSAVVSNQATGPASNHGLRFWIGLVWI